MLRINPYLLNPTPQGITITWFSPENANGTLTVEGPDLSSPLTLSSVGVNQPILEYTNAERTQTINGLSAPWLIEGGSFKHSISLRGLSPGQNYSYTVQQGSSSFSSTFKTAPATSNWERIRFIAMSDSETEPQGRITHREWQPGALGNGSQRPDLSNSTWSSRFGTTGTANTQTLRYPLTETAGYRENLAIVNSRRPDFLLMPGDLVQGGGYQPAWDEFFRHNAGEFDSGLSTYPILPALGNWETFGGLNGGYGFDRNGRFGPRLGRQKYQAYFDLPENGTADHRDNYYRVDYGPLTVLTLDSTNGEPDDQRTNYGTPGKPLKISNLEYTEPGKDTQENFNRAQYEASGGTDLSDFNSGSTQWNWVQAQLADARRQGQVIFVQFHHAPYSSGEHGQPMNHTLSSGQGGTPLRQYQGLFEAHGVAAVFSGHSELFERSFVDQDQNGIGVSYYDVGVAGDGLRGEKRTGPGFDAPLLNYNPYKRWSADQSEAETWQIINNLPQLTSGGKHYGHLEVNVEPFHKIDGIIGKILFTAAYSFPVLDDTYNLIRAERRTYRDEVLMLVTDQGTVFTYENTRRFTGTAHKDTLSGTTGADYLAGLADHDTYTINHVGDMIEEDQNQGTDVAVSSINYRLGNNVENLILRENLNLNGTGNALANRLLGNSRRNVLLGLDGNDFLDGKAGADQLVGGPGNDTYSIDNTQDVVLENPNEGIDTAQTFLNYTLPANLENLVLTGTAAANGTGNDTNNQITGNNSDNLLNGGLGIDILSGRGGKDIYGFQLGHSTALATDRIISFKIGVDKISTFDNSSNKLSVPTGFTRAANSNLTNLQSIATKVFVDADGGTIGNQPLGLNNAALVQARRTVYLIVNDARTGYQVNTDLMVDITGFIGALPALGPINPDLFFS